MNDDDTLSVFNCPNPKCQKLINAENEFCPNCRQIVALGDFIDKPANKIRRFQLVEVIGKGGYGKVYRALDRKLNRPRAIKQIDHNHYRPREWQILNEHQDLHFIPTVFDIFDSAEYGPAHSEFAYIVMDYIEGKTLKELTNPRWTVNRVSQFLEKLLIHLTELHNLKVIHRDIKPHNIKLRNPEAKPEDYKYVLLDFGIAKAGDSSEKAVGTPVFMPPEQTSGLDPNDARTDLFSLAMTACYLLIGGNHDNTISQLALLRNKHLTNGPLATLEPHIPQLASAPALNRLLCAMLATDKQYRPVSAENARQLLLTPLPPDLAPSSSKTGDKTLSSVPTGHLTLKESQCLGRGRALDLAWSPDGSALAVASSLGVYIYKPNSLETEPLIIPTREPATWLTYLHNGQKLAIQVGATTLAAIEVWKQQGRKFTREYEKEIGPDTSVAFGLDGNIFATVSDEGVRLWKTDRETPLHSLKERREDTNPGMNRALAFVPGSQVAAIASGRSVNLWRFQDGVKEASYTGSSSRVTAISFTPDGTMLAASAGRTVIVWRRNNPNPLATLSGLESEITDLAIAPDGQTLAIVCKEKVFLWQRNSQEPNLLFKGLDTEQITAVAFAPFIRSLGKLTLAIVAGGRVLIWRGENQQFETLEQHFGRFNSLAFSADSRFVAGLGGWLRLWQLQNNKLLKQAEGPSFRSNGLAFSPDGALLAATFKSLTQVWQTENAALLTSLEGEVACSNQVAFYKTKSGLYLVTIGENVARLWQLNPVKLRRELVEGLKYSIDLSLSQDGRKLAVLEDTQVKVWQLQMSGGDKPPQIILLPEQSIPQTLALSPDGKLLALLFEKQLQLYNLDGALPRLISEIDESAEQAIFSPDSSVLALIKNRVVNIWRIEDQDSKILFSLEGHKEVIRAVAFAPTKPLQMASASEDGTIRLWHLTR